MKVPILLPNIFNHPFTYESDQSLEIGDYVLVPFGKSKITGVVWDDFEKKNNIIFPNYNLSQPTAKNPRIIKKVFKLRYKLSKIFKKLLSLIF